MYTTGRRWGQQRRRPAIRKETCYSRCMLEERQVEEIVVGAIVDGCGRFLIQPRVGDIAMAGSWELPGGKILPEEDHAAALVREIAEETGLAVRVGDLAVALCHAYPDRRVALYAYVCEPVGDAKPPRWVRWTRPAEYREMPMPEANGPILDALSALLTADSSTSYK